MKSYLLSALKRQAAAGQQKFLELYPESWLVWEAGEWKAPRPHTFVLNTRAAAPVVAKAAEALVISLPNEPRLTVGRASDASLSLNDGTLSGQHLVLVRMGDRWEIEDLGSTNGTKIEGVRLRVGDRMPLRNGAAIVAGQVTLTFYTSEGLWTRLQR